MGILSIICRILFTFMGIDTTYTLSIICSDFRFFTGTQKLYRRLGIRWPDELKIPGGPMSVVKKDPLVLGWIKTLYSFHGIKEICLIAHADCRAYKAAGFDFDSDDAEQAFQEDQLRKAKEILLNVLPDVKIRMVYARLSANRKLIEYIEFD